LEVARAANAVGFLHGRGTSPASAHSRDASSVMTRAQLEYVAAAPMHWMAHVLSNTRGILTVFDLVWLRRTRGGIIDITHPFATGLDPRTGRRVWRENLLYRSRAAEILLEDDVAIVERVMDFMRGRVEQCAARPGAPHGVPSRMPPAVNLLHGPVHFHAVSLLFDDVPDAVQHFTDARFLHEVKRCIREQRRELVVILRDRQYNRQALARLACFFRTRLPFWANPNGNKARVQWGVPAPYPNINVITGAWIADTRALVASHGSRDVVRPPVGPGRYFQDGPYAGGWRELLFPERWLARFTTWRVESRGEKGNLYFTDARELRAGFRYDPAAPPTLAHRLLKRACARLRPAHGFSGEH
jgi:hypothetical protein